MSQPTLKLCSVNIRFESKSDKSNDWPFRKKVLFQILKNQQPDIFATQEGRKGQLYDLGHFMNSYQLIDTHRSWIEPRMYPTLFFLKSKFQLLDSGDFWLSQFPSISGTRSFNSEFPRLCTWAWLKDLESESNILLFNTHLDHLYPSTRLNQCTVLAQEMEKIISKFQVTHYFLLGDFNEGPENEGRKYLTKSLPLIDPWEVLKKENLGTYHRFDGKSASNQRIDWILHSSNLKSIDAEICQFHDNNLYPSDHHPIFATIHLPKIAKD